jgi:hypothetical protein
VYGAVTYGILKYALGLGAPASSDKQSQDLTAMALRAIEAKPGQAKGIDSALRVFAQTPLGPWLLVSVAAGLVIFGAFSCCEARWRNV